MLVLLERTGGAVGVKIQKNKKIPMYHKDSEIFTAAATRFFMC
jgi:hypothetical protein